MKDDTATIWESGFDVGGAQVSLDEVDALRHIFAFSRGEIINTDDMMPHVPEAPGDMGGDESTDPRHKNFVHGSIWFADNANQCVAISAIDQRLLVGLFKFGTEFSGEAAHATRPAVPCPNHVVG